MRTSYIYKGLSLLIMAVIVNTHLCSFCCSTGIFSCCGDDCADEQHEHHDDADHHDADGGCQTEHFAFFQTVGQYQAIHADAAAKVFQPLIALILPAEILQPKDIFHTAEIYTGFHPPPPRDNIHILIQSFLI